MTHPNPCLGCATNQHCCSRLSGLVLAREEYDRFFRLHEELISVTWQGEVAIVSAREGGGCPHWGTEGCDIYQERPTDCRVFPYITTQVVRKGRRVKVVFHDRTDCPKKDQLFLLLPEAGIRRLLAEFGKKAYGDDKTVIVLHEKENAAKWRNRIRAALRRQWHRMRGCEG